MLFTVVKCGKDHLTLYTVKVVDQDSSQEEPLYFEKDSGLLRKSDTVEFMGLEGEVPVTTRLIRYEAYGQLLLPDRA